MQVEALLIVSSTKEILYCSHNSNNSIDWNEYIERLIKLLPPVDQDLPPFLIFDNIVIGTRALGSLKIILAAPTTSNLVIESLLSTAVDQIVKIVKHVCKNEQTQASLLQRDHYIMLKLLLQQEISPSGYMHFIKESDFEQYEKY